LSATSRYVRYASRYPGTRPATAYYCATAPDRVPRTSRLTAHHTAARAPEHRPHLPGEVGGLAMNELRELKQLRDEDRKLRALVADLTLDHHLLQEIVRKTL
jgi:hypothetical protein